MTEALIVLEAQLRPMKVAEYEALAKLGVYDDEKVELLRGQVVRMAPQGEVHAWASQTLNRILFEALGRWADVRPGLPMNATEDSMPEPDFALVPRHQAGAPVPPHPTKALLLIEISHSSLRIDRAVKAPIYAETGSPEYWIIDVENGVLEVFRKPVKGAWTETFTLTARDTIRPVAFPEVELALAPILSALIS